MNTHIIAIFAVVAAVTVSGQLFGGSQVAEEGIQAAQNSALNLAENNALNQQAALNKEDRRQAVSLIEQSAKWSHDTTLWDDFIPNLSIWFWK